MKKTHLFLEMLLIFSIILFFSSCKQSQKDNNTNNDDTAHIIKVDEEAEIKVINDEEFIIPANFVYNYEGKIKNYFIFLHLEKNNDGFTGYYNYYGHQDSMLLKGSMISETEFELKEYNSQNKHTGTFTLEFQTDFSNQVWGEWKNIDETNILRVYLNKQVEGFIKFETYYCYDKFQPDNSENYCEFDYIHREPIACEDTEILEYVQDYISKFTQYKDIENTQKVEDRICKSKEHYINSNKEFANEFSSSNSYSIEINRNDKYILSFTIMFFEYAGGAHGYGTTDYYNLDLLNKKIFDYSDIIEDIDAFNNIAKEYLIEDNTNDVMLFEGDWDSVNLSDICDLFIITETRIQLYSSQTQVEWWAPVLLAEIPLYRIKNLLKSDCSLYKSI